MSGYNSFVLRIWSGDRGELRGTIEHVASRESLVFHDLQALIPFIRSWLDASAVAGPGAVEEATGYEDARDEPPTP